MGKASGLFFAAAAVAGVAYMVPWDDLDLSWSPDVAMSPAGKAGALDAVTPSGPAASRAESLPDTNQPPSAPELARLAPRTALGPPSRRTSLADDRVALGRELQRELARVGCYEGEINGTWTPATRKAMK